MPKNFLRLRRAARIVLLPSAEKKPQKFFIFQNFRTSDFFEIVFSEQIRHKKNLRLWRLEIKTSILEGEFRV